MSRSLNKVQLIGNITSDPEVKEFDSGKVCTKFSVATNRTYTKDTGEKKEESEFHRIIAWDKLGKTLSLYAHKGKKVYLEGRIASRKFTDKNGQERTISEIIAQDVLFLDSKPKEGGEMNG